MLFPVIICALWQGVRGYMCMCVHVCVPVCVRMCVCVVASMCHEAGNGMFVVLQASLILFVFWLGLGPIIILVQTTIVPCTVYSYVSPQTSLRHRKTLHSLPQSIMFTFFVEEKKKQVKTFCVPTALSVVLH